MRLVDAGFEVVDDPALRHAAEAIQRPAMSHRPVTHALVGHHLGADRAGKHHDVVVLPARSGRATDKARVEAAVGAIQTRILLTLRHEIFFSLETMNTAIRRELDRLNEAPMACGESRRAIFGANERAHLQPLPANPWE